MVKNNAHPPAAPAAWRVLSLFSGIGGMDMGFDGQVIVHKDSIAKDCSDFIKCPVCDIENFVELYVHNFKIIFQNDILKGARDVCSFNQKVTNYHTESIYDLLNEEFAFPAADGYYWRLSLSRF